MSQTCHCNLINESAGSVPKLQQVSQTLVYIVYMGMKKSPFQTHET